MRGCAHLEEQKNKNLAFHVFVEMARRGIDPRKFVEWYAEEGMLLSKGGWDRLGIG
jgi:hypothetical protein